VRPAEELLEHQDSPQVTVEGVLGGEADAGEHLLAVPGRRRSGQPQRAQPASNASRRTLAIWAIFWSSVPAPA
jgi:hypothetical protein